MNTAASAVHYITALTPREQEVLEHIEAGRSNDEIARALRISKDGVKYHLKSIFCKLGARRRTEAVRLGREFKLIDPSNSVPPLRRVVIAQ